jgi:hypothetical protein
LENESVPAKVEKLEPKQKRRGKIAKVYKLHQEGLSTKEIAEKMKLKETIVRSYVWRSAHRQEYKQLLERYYQKKQQAKKKENA